MGQIKVVESKSQKKKFVFHELKIGEVFRAEWGTLYLKVAQNRVFNLKDLDLVLSDVSSTLDVYPVNATLTVEE